MIADSKGEKRSSGTVKKYADSTPGEVYFAIADENGIRAYHCTVPGQPTRLSYKLYMSEVIADKVRQQ